MESKQALIEQIFRPRSLRLNGREEIDVTVLDVKVLFDQVKQSWESNRAKPHDD